MKRTFVAGVLLSAMVIAAPVCGSAPSAQHASTPTVERDAMPAVTPAATIWPFSPPRATPTPAPLIRPAGHAMVLRAHGSVLDLVSLDGTAPQLLAQGDRNCGGPCFPAGDDAGSASVDGTVFHYYTHAVRSIESPTGVPAAYYELRRFSASSGSSSVVATFDAYDKPPIAAVSPDGQDIAYAGVDGIHWRDIASGGDILLLRDDIDPQVGARRVYLQPRWSPRGDWLVTSVGGQEGANALLIRPLDASPHEIELQVGGIFANWSANGSQLCLSQTGYDLGNAGILSSDDRVYHDLTAQLGAGIGTTGCAWRAGGALAVSYRRADDSAGVAFFAPDGSLLRDVPHFWHYASVAGWLADGSGVIATWQDPDATSHTGIVLTDGTTRSLPFAADQVLAVLP